MIDCDCYYCMDDVDYDAVICYKAKQMEFAKLTEMKDMIEVENSQIK